MHTAYEVDKINSIGIAASDFIRSVQDSFVSSNTELRFDGSCFMVCHILHLARNFGTKDLVDGLKI